MLKKLIGEKCYLAVIDEDHAAEVASWSNNLEMALRTGDASIAMTVGKQKEFLGYMNGDYAHGFYIVDKETDKPVGIARLMRIDFIQGTGVMGMFIGNMENRSRGIGKEAASLLLDFAFNILNLGNIMVEIAGFNEASLALCRSCGFKEIGRRRKSIRFGNRYFDEVFMDLLSDEFYGSLIRNTIDEIMNNTR